MMSVKSEVEIDGTKLTVIEQGRAVYVFHPEGAHSPHLTDAALKHAFPQRGEPSRLEWNSWIVGEDGRVEFAGNRAEGALNGTRITW